MSTRSASRAWRTGLLSLGLMAAVLVGRSYAQTADPIVSDTVLETLQQPPVGAGSGQPQITVVYQDNAIYPENRDAARLIRESGAFERLADWTNQRVALTYP